VEAIRGLPLVTEAAMFGRAVHALVTDEATATTEIRRALAAAGRACDSLGSVPPSLEDVFVALVRREGGAVEG
jgi:ABC-2 type transport system ATP-binding protein